VLLRPDTNKLDIVIWVQDFNCTLSLSCKLSDQGAVLDRVILIHGAPNGDTLRVNNDNALSLFEDIIPYLDSFVSVDAVDGLFYLLGL